jgi:hypothetical protein
VWSRIDLIAAAAQINFCTPRVVYPAPNDEGDAPIYLVRTQSFDDYPRESGTEDDKRQVRTPWCIPRGSAVPGRSASSVLGLCHFREVHLATLVNKSSAGLAVNKRQTMDHLTLKTTSHSRGRMQHASRPSSQCRVHLLTSKRMTFKEEATTCLDTD